MKLQDIKKAIAELDGLATIYPIKHRFTSEPFGELVWWTGSVWQDVPPYPTSRDAIMSVIEKQSQRIKQKIILHFVDDDRTYASIWDFFKATPLQLCEVLLKETNKFNKTS